MNAIWIVATGYTGLDGFLGTRASFMMDFVVCAMLLVVPLMLLSVFLVKSRREFLWHKRLQTSLAALLLVTIVLFEIDVRWHGWVTRADTSPYWREGSWNDLIDLSLAIHLCFAIPTPLLWGVLVWLAYRGFPRPPRPSLHSGLHKPLGRVAVASMTATTITGWVFYWLAFGAV